MNDRGRVTLGLTIGALWALVMALGPHLAAGGVGEDGPVDRRLVRRAALDRVRAVAAGRAGVDPRAAAEILDAETVGLAVEQLLRDIDSGRAAARSAARLPRSLLRDDVAEVVARAGAAIARARVDRAAARTDLDRSLCAAHAVGLLPAWRVVAAVKTRLLAAEGRPGPRLAPPRAAH